MLMAKKTEQRRKQRFLFSSSSGKLKWKFLAGCSVKEVPLPRVFLHQFFQSESCVTSNILNSITWGVYIVSPSYDFLLISSRCVSGSMQVMMQETWHPGNGNVSNSWSMDFILSFFGFLITQSHVRLLYRLYIILKIEHCFRSRKVVDTFEQLLGGEELYHYHSKLMMKEVLNSIGSLLKMNCSRIENHMKLTNTNDKYDNTRQRQAGSMCGIKIMDTGRCHSCSLQLCCVCI